MQCLDKNGQYPWSYSKEYSFQIFHQGSIQLLSTFMDVCSHSSNNLINKIHERTLRLTSEINDIPFNELLSINNKVSMHNKNIQTLLIEVYKNLNGLSPTIMLDLFTIRDNIYNLRNFREFYCEKKKTIRYGTETVTYKANQL